MLTCKKNFFFQKKVIILKIFIILFISSCNLNKFQNNQYQLKKIIIPKEINIFTEDPQYKIPYTEEDLKKNKNDILPPV